MPGHVFRLVALDGNAVPTQAQVPVLWLGTAERVPAIVEMNNPGVWVMGDMAYDDRGRGMGIVVEYAGRAGRPRWMPPWFTLQEGRRYRLKFRNAGDDVHPLHLHRHSFELTRIGGKPTVGVIKDVVMSGGFQEAEVDFVADNPSLTFLHCHQQLHMDFGLMALFSYA